MAWDTVANVVSDAAIELGLVSTAIANPFASPDANILRLLAFTKSLGQDLSRGYQWSQLEKTHTFSTADGTASYSLPADFVRLIDNTQWNRTQQLQLSGPANAQDWQLFKARSSTGVVYKWFRIFGDLFYIHPTPTAIETVAFEYVSSYWVDTGGGIVGDAAAPTTAADSLLFDRRLLVSGLKLRFGGIGFDTTQMLAEYDTALANARSNDGAAPVLSLSGRSQSSWLRPNLPDSGFGT